MSSLVIAGDTSGSITLQAPSTAGSTVLNLPAVSGTLALTSGSQTFTNLTVTNDASISGLTVGKGGNSYNTVFGYQAAAVATGGSNLAIGYQALNATTSSAGNTAVGDYRALYANTTGANNTALGNTALTSNTTGSSNVGIGYQSLYSNTTASNNTAVGHQAGYSNTTGTYNTLLGMQAGYSSATNNGLTALGWQAGYASTADGSVYVGSHAGYAATATHNTFLGADSGYLVTSGAANTILGRFSGNQGGLDIRTASNYIVLSDGDGNPRLISDNIGRVYVGLTATAGYLDGYLTVQSTGTNPAITAATNSSGSATQFVYSAWAPFNSGNNVFHSFETETSPTIRGTISYNRAGGLVAYNTTSDQRLKENIVDAPSALSKINSVQIRSFDWKETGNHNDFGVIAQELHQVAPECVTEGQDNEDGTMKSPWAVDTSALVPALIKAIQELNTLVTTQAAEIAALKAKVGA